VLRLNLHGTVHPTLVFGELMAGRKKGSVVNISSMAALRPLKGVAGYSVAKAGIDSFTRWLAVELARHCGPGLRVNAIAPGFFVTTQNRAVLVKEDGSPTDRGRAILARTPMGRFGDPAELQGACLWLCSDAASFVTGVVIPIDGGYSADSGIQTAVAHPAQRSTGAGRRPGPPAAPRPPGPATMRPRTTSQAARPALARPVPRPARSRSPAPRRPRHADHEAAGTACTPVSHSVERDEDGQQGSTPATRPMRRRRRGRAAPPRIPGRRAGAAGVAAAFPQAVRAPPSARRPRRSQPTRAGALMGAAPRQQPLQRGRPSLAV
jgi:hypothetical protein